jgi:threonine synthase
MVALDDTDGEIIEVDDKEVVNALWEIIKTESLIPEPTSAVVYAALKKLNYLKENKIVLVQTAGGMKNLKEIMEILLKNTAGFNS